MANKNNSAKKIDLSSVKKINFAKLKRLKAVNIISKFAIYFVLICIGFIFLEPIFEMISKSIMTTKDLIDPSFILPVPLLTVPRIMMFSTVESILGFKLINTVVPQFLLALLGQGTYSTMLVLIFYNFFNMIPKSLDEAAMIDGAGSLKVFYHVAIRLSISTILVVFLFSFVFNWNETYTTNILTGDALELLPGRLSLFDNGSTSNAVSELNEAIKMAATLIAIAPLLVLYACVQRQFIEGIENTGITGE